MKSTNFNLKVLILLGVFVGFCITTCGGITDDCNYIGFLIKFVPSIIGDALSCISDPRSNFLTPSFKPGNFMCVVKCVLMKGGMLDEDGSIDVVGALEFLASILPPHLKEKADEIVVECQSASEKIDIVNDEPCLSYLPLLTCSIQSLIKVFGNAAVDTLTGKNPVNIKKAISCVFLPPPIEKTGDEENSDVVVNENSGAQTEPPEAERLQIEQNQTSNFIYNRISNMNFSLTSRYI